jgi:hypothetical protein
MENRKRKYKIKFRKAWDYKFNYEKLMDTLDCLGKELNYEVISVKLRARSNLRRSCIIIKCSKEQKNLICMLIVSAMNLYMEEVSF